MKVTSPGTTFWAAVTVDSSTREITMYQFFSIRSVAVRVTVETGVAVVRISGDTVVVVVHRILVIVLMTIDAGEHTIVRGVVVAIRTCVPLTIVVSAVDGEELVIVIEGRVAPSALIMALGAIRAESGGGVVGVRRAVVVRHMASATRRWRTGVAVRMALDARRGRVRAMQRKVGGVVIERGVAPCGLIVACRAIRAEA